MVDIIGEGLHISLPALEQFSSHVLILLFWYFSLLFVAHLYKLFRTFSFFNAFIYKPPLMLQLDMAICGK